MIAQDAIELGRRAIVTALLVSSPMLVIGLVIGLLVGLLQALTQVQDQAISVVPKMVAVMGCLALLLPWFIQLMMEYSHDLFANIPKLIGAG